MNSFEFATATEIVFGRGRVSELGQRVRALGTRVLVVTGAHPERVLPALERGNLLELVVGSLAIRAEPSTTDVERGVALAREAGVEVVVGVGGGSALDAAKAVAVLATNPGEPLDYLEVVGRGRPLVRPSLPCVLVPTTAGTGAEVTKNAVLAVEAEHVKVSLRSLFMLPKLALVDSELTHGVPRDVTAATGLDAFTQLFEPYVSRARGPLTDALCVEGMRRSARSLRRAYDDGADADARDDLALASLFGGLCLANAKLGAVHGLAGPLGGALLASHGAICARLLPEVMGKNLERARKAQDRDLVERFETVARILTGQGDAPADAGVRFAYALVETLEVPRLSRYGLTREQSEDIVERARVSSSMKGNPVELTKDELFELLERAS
jgi:alcohol dehydrogenase class IV